MTHDTINDTAFILAAGFGTRLRPHTSEIPKPMVDVAGRSLIQRTIDHLENASVKTFVINTHYKHEKLEKHFSSGLTEQIMFSHEPDILDTGGGIKNALTHFKGQDFFVLSGDGLWDNPPNMIPALTRMKEAWNPDIMDILALLQPIGAMVHTKGIGDYIFNDPNDAHNDAAKITRSKTQSGSHMFTSIRINRTAIFDDTPDTPFSYLQLLDKAEQNGRLYGIAHNGLWHHISTPDDLHSVRTLYRHEKTSDEGLQEN